MIDKPADPTEWLNNLAIREKPDGLLHICLDPKYLNEAIKREHHPIHADAATHKHTTAEFISRYGLLKKDALFQLSEALDEASKKIKNLMSDNVCDGYLDTSEDAVL